VGSLVTQVAAVAAGIVWEVVIEHRQQLCVPAALLVETELLHLHTPTRHQLALTSLLLSVHMAPINWQQHAAACCNMQLQCKLLN
jgi:hypothetical protein